MSSLALIGLAMISFFMWAVMTKRISAMNGLIVIPMVVAVALGFGPQVGGFAKSGIAKVVNIATMIAFAILYFGIMIDAGLFDPLVNKILDLVHGDPMRVVVGTTLIAGVVSLDGDGATTYMITCSAMMPIHKRLGINPLILPAVTIMINGVWNLLPWGGPTGRVMASLGAEASEVFIPLLPGMVAGAIWVVFVAYVLGMRERKRLGILEWTPAVAAQAHKEFSHCDIESGADECKEALRPGMFWVNLVMTVGLMGALLAEVLPLNVLFMLFSAFALIINYPNLKDQGKRVQAHAENAFPVLSMIFAAGIFMGVLSGTKMVDAIANLIVALIPPSMGPYMTIIVAFASIPGTFFLSNDAFYFGVLPVLVKAGAAYGIPAAEMGRASLLGQGGHLLSPMVASTYLLIGMTGINFGDFQKYTLPWATGTSIVFIIVALLTGIITVH